MKSRPPWMLGVALALLTVAWGVVSNLGAQVLPQEWLQSHQLAIWVSLGLMATMLVLLTYLATPSHDRQDLIPATALTPETTLTMAVEQVIVGDLPARPKAYIPRVEVDAVQDALRDGARVVALTGGRGVGKSQIAAEVARQAAEKGLPLVAWVSAESVERLLGDLYVLAERLGVANPEYGAREAALQVRDVLAARLDPGLLVVDNANLPIEVAEYLPSIGRVQVIITSTDLAFGDWGTSIPVPVFDRDQSVAYLRARTGRDDPGGADALAQELGDSPLGLAQAGAVMSARPTWSYRDFVTRLQEKPITRVLSAAKGLMYPRGVAEAILQSAQVTQEADPTGLSERILQLCSVLAPEGISVTLMDSMLSDAQFDRDVIEERLGDLVGTSLLSWTQDLQGVVIHRLVARAIRDQAEAAGVINTVLEAAAAALTAVLPDEEHLWENREEAQSLIGHAITLWQVGAGLAERNGSAPLKPPAVAQTVNWAMGALLVVSDLPRAIDLGTLVLTTRERMHGPEHPSTMTARHLLARAFTTAGNNKRALALATANVEARTRLMGRDHPDTLISRYQLALTQRREGILDVALNGMQEVAAAFEKALGADAAWTLTAREGLAVCHRLNHDYDKALVLFNQNLADRRRILGPNHPDTLTSRNNLAMLYRRLGKPEQAIVLMEQTLADRVRLFGPEHPQTLVSRNDVAAAYQQVGDVQAALEGFTSVLNDRMRYLGPDHPQTLLTQNSLAKAHLANGEVGVALRIFDATLAHRQRILGPENPQTLTTRNDRALALAQAGDVPQACAQLRDLLAVARRVLGSKHPLTQAVEHNLEEQCE